MAGETLTTEMQTVGDRAAARGVNRVGRAIRGVGNDSKRANKNTGLFARGLQFLGTRMGMIIILGAIMSVTLGPPLLVTIALLTAAMVALGGVMLPIFAIGAGVLMTFKATAGQAGTAASQLADMLALLKHAFRVAISPAAAVVMRAITEAFRILIPILESFRGPLTDFAKYLGTAIQEAAVGIAAMAPQLKEMLSAAGPLVVKMGRAIVPFIGALITLATVGMPVLSKILDWLIAFTTWLGPAIQSLSDFAHQGSTINAVSTYMRDVAAAGVYLWGVISDLATIVYNLYLQNEDLIRGLGVGLLAALVAVAGAISWTSDNMQIMGPILTAAIGIWGIYTAAVWAAAAAGIAFTAAGSLLVIGIAAIVVGLLLLYQKWGWFHNAVNNTFNWIKDHWPLLLAILTGPFGLATKFILDHLNQIKDVAQSVLDLPGKLWDKVQGVGSFITHPHLASGGHVIRGGSAVVGEQGPEVVSLPTDATVHPNGTGPGQAVIVHHQTILDGRVIAESVQRAAVRKQATR